MTISTEAISGLRAFTNLWDDALNWKTPTGGGGKVLKADMLAILDAAESQAEALRTASELEDELEDAERAASHEKDILLGILKNMRDRVGELMDQRELLAQQLDKQNKAATFDAMLDMLRANATDPGAARNYVELSFKWDKAIAPKLPFKNVSVVFRREGAKSPGELVKEALESRNELAALARDLLKRWIEAGGCDVAGQVLTARINELESSPASNPLVGVFDK